MARGSHTTYGGWEAKVCALCGQPIVKDPADKAKARPLFFSRFGAGGQPVSRHMQGCPSG